MEFVSPPSSEEQQQQQCRFCLETGGGVMVSPCVCAGSAKWVHQKCLDRWRQSGDRKSRKRCSVCRSKWTVAAPAEDDGFFLRRVKTAARYRQVQPRERPTQELEARLRSLAARRGFLVAQTEFRASREDQTLAGHTRTGTHITHDQQQLQQQRREESEPPRRPFSEEEDSEGQNGSSSAVEEGNVAPNAAPTYGTSSLVVVGERRPRRQAFSSSGPMASLVAAVLEARAIRHWHKGVFLGLYVGRGAGTDGSDSIVAANLTRPLAALDDEEEFGRRGGTTTTTTRTREPASTPRRFVSRRFEWLRSAARSLRAARETADAPREEDDDDDDDEDDDGSASSSSSEGSSSDEDDERYRRRRLRRSARSIRALEAAGVPCPCFSGGPVHRDNPVGLLLYDGDDLDTADEEPPFEPWRSDDGLRGIVATPLAMVDLVPRLRASGASNLRAVCWRGVAVWSTDQLIAEITRGSWALARAQRSDIDHVLSDREQRKPNPTDLWRDVLQGGRDVVDALPLPTTPHITIASRTTPRNE